MSPDLPSSDRLPESLERSSGPSKADRARIFVIFDTEHDADLYALLRAQSDNPGSGFSATGGSEGSNHTEVWRARVRSQIRDADLVVVICGEHTEASPGVHAALLIAIDEEKPYFLLWGRREVMCTKPIGAARAEGMYSWTRQILHEQIAFNLRQSSTEVEARSLRKETRDGPRPKHRATVRNEPSADPATPLTGR